MTKDELAQFIGASELSGDDKNMWQMVLASLDGMYLDHIAEFVDSNHDNLVLITQNILKKKSAFETKDHSALGHILKEEKDFLTKE